MTESKSIVVYVTDRQMEAGRMREEWTEEEAERTRLDDMTHHMASHHTLHMTDVTYDSYSKFPMLWNLETSDCQVSWNPQ